MSPPKIVTLKPDGTIKCAVPVLLNAAVRGLSAGVRNPRRIAVRSAASGCGSDREMTAASVIRR